MSSKLIFSFYLPSPLFCRINGQKNKYYFDSGFLVIYTGLVLYTTIIPQFSSFKEQLIEKITHTFKMIQLNLFSSAVSFSCCEQTLIINVRERKCPERFLSFQLECYGCTLEEDCCNILYSG